MLKSEVRILDMGYYGNSHEKVGIVLGVKKHVIIVLNITDPKNRYQETIHRESFTAGNQNLSDCVSTVKYETCSEVKRASIGNVEIKRRNQSYCLDKTVNSKYIDLIRSKLYRCKHVYINADTQLSRSNNLDSLIKDIWESEQNIVNADFEKLFLGEVNYWNKFVKLSTINTFTYNKVWTLCVSYNEGVYTLHQLGYQYVATNKK